MPLLLNISTYGRFSYLYCLAGSMLYENKRVKTLCINFLSQGQKVILEKYIFKLIMKMHWIANDISFQFFYDHGILLNNYYCDKGSVLA